jgi:hypothetical protein
MMHADSNFLVIKIECALFSGYTLLLCNLELFSDIVKNDY